jgi:predicted dehydrogenase
VAGSRATASRSGGVELAGEHGQLIGDHILNQAWLVRGTVASLLPVPEPVPTVRETLRSFIQALRTRGSLPIPLEDGLKAVAIADACYRSAASGREELVAIVD